MFNSRAFWAFQLIMTVLMAIESARLIHVHWGFRVFAWLFAVCAAGCVWCLWSLRRRRR